MDQNPQQCAIKMNKSCLCSHESPPAYDSVIKGLVIDMELPKYIEAVSCVIAESKRMEVQKEWQGMENIDICIWKVIQTVLKHFNKIDVSVLDI